MKICIIAINYAPEVTGCAPYTQDLANNLATRGHKVTAVVGVPHYPEWKVPSEYRRRQKRDEILDGVRVNRCRFYIPKRMNALTRICYELSFLMSGLLRARKESPEVVVAVSPALADLAIGVFLKRKTNAKLMILVQDLMSAATKQTKISGGGGVVTRLAYSIEKFLLSHADSIATIDSSFSKSILEMGVTNPKLVDSPNYLIHDLKMIDTNTAREFFGWDKDKFIIMHTGNMGLKQDLKNLVECMRFIESPNFMLVLAGDGSQRHELEELAQGDERICFTGLVPTESYATLLSASDVLILNEAPTVTDMSLPSKLTSYIASKKPILGAVVPGGNTSIALSGLSNAKQIPPGKPQELAAVILQMSIFSNRENAASGIVKDKNSNDYLRNLRVTWVESVCDFT